MICPAVSPILMGWTPWFLSRAKQRMVISGAMLAGSTSSVQRHFATMAREWQSSRDADLGEVHSLPHPSTLRPFFWYISVVAMGMSQNSMNNIDIVQTKCKSVMN